MTRDRFLSAILIGIGVLVVAALILFFTRQRQVSYGDDSTPEGALQNYFLAIQKQDYARAYTYLADTPNKPSLLNFEQPFISYQSQAVANSVVEIVSTVPDSQGETVIIQVAISQGPQNLFGNDSRPMAQASLVRQNGAWKVSSAPYPYMAPEPAVPAPVKPIPSLQPSPTFAAPKS